MGVAAMICKAREIKVRYWCLHFCREEKNVAKCQKPKYVVCGDF